MEPSGKPVHVEVDQEPVFLTPGVQAVLAIRLSNTGSSADAYTLAVEGVPEAWVIIPDAPVPLAPGSQATVGMLVTPSRAPESLAGSYSVTLSARSVTTPIHVGMARMHWMVQRYLGASLSIMPPRADGRSEARYQVLLRNTGNADTTFMLGAGDDAPPLTYLLSQTKVPLTAGQTATIPLQISAPQRLIGEPALHTFEVRAETSDYSARTSAEFTHLPTVRSWVPVALLSALLLVVLLAS